MLPPVLRRRLVPIVVLVGLGLSPVDARADDPPADTTASAPPLTLEATAAKEHFARAKALYLRGEYRQSILELQTARRLDPHAIELVYNLAVVHEKLGEIDAAIASWREYEALAPTDEERKKAQTSVNRLDAFKKKRPAASTPLLAAVSTPKRGKLDGLTVATGGVGIAGLTLGTVFGVLALSSQPEGQARTTSSRSYESLQAQVDQTSSRALIADIGFAVGAASCVASVLLYVLRFDTPKVAPGRIGLVSSPGGIGIGGAWQ